MKEQLYMETKLRIQVIILHELFSLRLDLIRLND